MRGGGGRRWKQHQRSYLKYGSWGRISPGGREPCDRSWDGGWVGFSRRTWEAALTLGRGGPADVVENDASRFGARDPRVPQARPCGGQCGPKACPKGPRPRGAPDPFPAPRARPGPPTWSPSSSPQLLSEEGRGGVRGFTTQMKADPSRAVRLRTET